MWALPPGFRLLDGNQATGLSCPDCDGVLQVSVADPDSGYLAFTCRIGHAYSLAEVLAAKETAIEQNQPLDLARRATAGQPDSATESV